MNYPSIRIEGAILSPDILDRLDDASGQRPADFGLDHSAKVKDEIARAWADAQDYWRIFQRRLDTLKPGNTATSETRNQWMVPLLGLLGYQLEYQSRGAELNGKTYPISHRAAHRGNTPVHIIGYQTSLDQRPNKAANTSSLILHNFPKMSAHAMVQEYLNLHDELYGLVSNGRVLRLLRDSSRLIKLSYLEFDLDRIFTDGLFADFALLFRLLHATRLPQTAATASASLIERYHQNSIEQGTRIREGLRRAVTEALQQLGTGFLANPGNTALRQRIETGELRPDNYFKYLLRLVYRLLFLMVIEERGLVFAPGTPARFMQIYRQHYSVQRLRRLAVTRGLKTARFHDAWAALQTTFQLFERPEQAAKLGTTALTGQLFHPDSLGPLADCRLANAALFSALDRLCYFDDPKTGQRTPVNFGALATEEFGSVYESLLELHPLAETTPTPYFAFKQAAGNERKTSGSYYTPSSLVDCLLDSALAPVLDDRIEHFAAQGYPSADAAILALKVCDPACGSGHFLIAAAQRIARRLALLRAGDEEPGPALLRHSLREVIGHCIYGVDINPMSVELCKLGLWLEAVEPGKPLTFLDHHIKCGNSLLGATPEAVQAGIPDEAYKPISGDSKDAATWMKKLNKDAKTGQGNLFDLFDADPWERLGNLPAAIAKLENFADDTPEALEAKEKLYREIVEGYDNARLLHDAWCAAFVWPKIKIEPGTELTTRHLREIEHNPHRVSPWLKNKIRALAGEYRFFHWHLEYPTVFGLEGNGGFDCVLGNPPWEKINLKEQEFFAERCTEITNASNTSIRKLIIAQLATNNPTLMAEFQAARRKSEGESHFLRNSELYPLCGRGDINLYAVFAEKGRIHLSKTGLMGMVLPSGIATDDTTKFYFQNVMGSHSLVSLFDFENKGIFPGVHNSYKFCLFTVGSGQVLPIGRKQQGNADFVFFAHSVDDLQDLDRRFNLNSNDISLLSPNTHTCPIFRFKKDAEICKSICKIVSAFIVEGSELRDGWSIEIGRMFHSSDDSNLFIERRINNQILLPLYEAKCFAQFDHRFSTFKNVWEDVLEDKKADPDFSIDYRYGILPETVPNKFKPKIKEWIFAYRLIARSTDIRTLISAILPKAAVVHSANIILNLSAQDAINLLSNMNAFVADYICRQTIGGTNLSLYVLQQVRILSSHAFRKPCSWSNTDYLQDWILPRALELTYTAWDLEPFARDCLEGLVDSEIMNHEDGLAAYIRQFVPLGIAPAALPPHSLPPFRWDEARRFLLRCELDAAFFHLYGINRDDVDYIMETFPIVKRKDEAKHGEYRTKRVILKIYDALQQATDTGQPYQTLLDPPPADPRCCHPAS